MFVAKFWCTIDYLYHIKSLVARALWVDHVSMCTMVPSHSHFLGIRKKTSRHIVGSVH